MILVIDGYNVLKQALYNKKITEKERSAFIRILDVYARKKELDIVLVFDGGSYGATARERIGVIVIIYSGAKESADAIIMQRLAELKGRDVLMVSSDRQLRKQAAHMGFHSIGSMEFYTLLIEQQESSVPEQKGGVLIKMTTNENPELDELMAQSMMQGVNKKSAHRDNADKKSSVKTLPKKQRTLLKKVRKL